MAKKKLDFKALANKAAKITDHNQTKSSTEFTPAAEGTTLARFVEYVEYGDQPQRPYKGQSKPPAAQGHAVFELLGSKWVREIEVNGEKKTIADRIKVPFTINLGARATFKKLYEKMRAGRDDINHISQMLGDGFKVTVVHNKSEKNGKIYANIQDADGNFLIAQPVKNVENDEGEVIDVKKLKVPEPLSDIRLFIWDMPTQEMWDSLFIDGEREVTGEDGKNKTVSKNWMQNLILGATNFEGSPIQTLLEGSDELPDDPEDLIDEEAEEDVSEEDETEEEDTEEDGESSEEVDADEDEVEEEEEAPKKKVAAKASAKKPSAAEQLAAKKAATKPAAKTAAKKTATATTATKSPSKSKPSKADDADAEMRELGLID